MTEVNSLLTSHHETAWLIIHSESIVQLHYMCYMIGFIKEIAFQVAKNQAASRSQAVALACVCLF